MNDNQQGLRLLGLAMRAGAIAAGEGKAEDSLRRGRAKLVLLASDASANTDKKFCDKCRYYGVPLIRAADRYGLGACLGREFAVVAAVEDENFANRLTELLSDIGDKTEEVIE